MRVVITLIASMSFLSACGRTGESMARPEPKYIGTWSLTSKVPAPLATDVKVKDGAPPLDDEDPCSGFEIKAGTVDAGFIKILASGLVLSAQNISDTNKSLIPIGELKSDGLFVPYPAVEEDYILGFKNLISGSVSVKPLIYLSLNQNHQALKMDIKVVSNSAAGLYMSQVVEAREYRKISGAEEQALILMALQCLGL